MVRQSKHPERRSSFPKACSDFEWQPGAADACPMGDIFSLFDHPSPYPHPYLPIQLGMPFRGLTWNTHPPSSFLIFFHLPLRPPSFFLPQLLTVWYILSKTNCFLDLLQLKASLPTTWYVQWLRQQWPVLRRCYLKPRVQPEWRRTAKRGWEVSSYISAHASFCLWLEAFPNRLQNYQLIKGKKEAGISKFLK